MASPIHQTRSATDPSRLLPWLRRANPIFQQLSDRDAAGLFSICTLKDEARGRYLQRLSEVPASTFIVISGTVALRVMIKGMVRDLFGYGEGQIAGLIGLIDRSPVPYELVTVGDTQVIVIDTLKFSQLTAAFHPTSTAFLTALQPVMAAHLNELQTRILRELTRGASMVAGSGETFGRGDR